MGFGSSFCGFGVWDLRVFWGWALSCLVGAAALLLLLTFGGCRLGFAVWDLIIGALVLGLGVLHAFGFGFWAGRLRI